MVQSPHGATRVTIGVDLGARSSWPRWSTADGHVSSLRRWPCRVSGYDESLDAIAELVASLRRAAEDRGDAVVGVGAAIAALPDRASATGFAARRTSAGWHDRPLRADLQAHVVVP